MLLTRMHAACSKLTFRLVALQVWYWLQSFRKGIRVWQCTASVGSMATRGQLYIQGMDQAKHHPFLKCKFGRWDGSLTWIMSYHLSVCSRKREGDQPNWVWSLPPWRESFLSLTWTHTVYYSRITQKKI